MGGGGGLGGRRGYIKMLPGPPPTALPPHKGNFSKVPVICLPGPKIGGNEKQKIENRRLRHTKIIIVVTINSEEKETISINHFL
jgi:hypothetical protein